MLCVAMHFFVLVVQDELLCASTLDVHTVFKFLDADTYYVSIERMLSKKYLKPYRVGSEEQLLLIKLHPFDIWGFRKVNLPHGELHAIVDHDMYNTVGTHWLWHPVQQLQKLALTK